MPKEGAETQDVIEGQSTVVEVVNEDQPEQAADSIRAGYDRIANPDKVEDEEPTAKETAPPEQILTNEQAKELIAQVSRIPELEKQLRDAGGRYGSLKQTIEQLQQRIETSRTSGDTAANSTDAKELLADLWEEFPEIAEKLQGAFSKVMNSGGQVDPASFKELIKAEIDEERKTALQESMDRLTEAHPTWMQDRETPQFAEWKKTLNPRVLARFNRSQDPDYVAEKLDEYKDWLMAQEHPKQTVNAATQRSKQRLANSVLPTTSAGNVTHGEPDPKSSIRAGYERVARLRLR